MENSERTKIPSANFGFRWIYLAFPFPFPFLPTLYALRLVALLLWRLIGTLRSSLFEREDDILSVYNERRGNLALFTLLVIFVIGFLIYIYQYDT